MSKEKKKLIAEEIVPLIEKMSPESQERILGYAKGLIDQNEYEAAKAGKKEAS